MKWCKWFLILLIFTSCCPEEEECKCPVENEVCIADKCVCPPDKFKLRDDLCRTLHPNEFYGINADCPCLDTLTISLGSPPNSTRLFEIDGNVMHASFNGQYFERPQGDSTFFFFPQECFQNGSFIRASVFGNELNETTWQFYFKWYDVDDFTLKKECTFIMSR